ncbi:MAG: hypothetical protein IPK16_04945 [Anaerolineales bacterium]|nr:hypothetical protein [Anaerolineales bacterium]
MPDVSGALQSIWNQLAIGRLPSPESIVRSMDPVAWLLTALLVSAVIVGVVFTLSTRRTFLQPDALESSPELLLARIKQDPTQLAPISIISRLGADSSLELLEYGDQIRTHEWRYRWNSVREELLRLLSEQNAFGPTYALARYYRSADKLEPETLRIRRTALIHKFGVARYVEPDGEGRHAELRVRAHPAEVEGDLGFGGETLWLLPDEPAGPVQGPLVELDPIEFRTLQDADLRMSIRRSPTIGGGFRLTLTKRHGYWIVSNEEMEWVS